MTSDPPFRPRCLNGEQSLGHSTKGYIMPCCYVDSWYHNIPEHREHVGLNKLWSKSLKISNNKTSILSQENMDQIHRSVKKKFTNDKNVYVHKLSSLEASKLFNKNYFDFVYIDASHSYEDVKLDLETWFPKIKKDGLLTGDDYYEPSKFSFTYGYGVIKAVDEFVKKNALDENFYTKGTQYIIQKN